MTCAVAPEDAIIGTDARATISQGLIVDCSIVHRRTGEICASQIRASQIRANKIGTAQVRTS